MKKLLIILLALGSISSYAKCSISLPYSGDTLRAFFLDDTYTGFTTLDRFAEKRGVSIVKEIDAQYVVEKYFTESLGKSLFCGKVKRAHEFLVFDGIEFEGDTFSVSNCESMQRGSAATSAARDIIKYISKKYNCVEDTESEVIETDYSMTHEYYNCEIRLKSENGAYYLRAQRPNCSWDYSSDKTTRKCVRPAAVSSDKLFNLQSEGYGLMSFQSKKRAKANLIKYALKVCHEVTVENTEPLANQGI